MQAIRDDHLRLMTDQQERMAGQIVSESERTWAYCRVSLRNEHDQTSCHDFGCDHDSDLSPTSELNGDCDQIAGRLGKLMRHRIFETAQRPMLWILQMLPTLPAPPQMRIPDLPEQSWSWDPKKTPLRVYPNSDRTRPMLRRVEVPELVEEEVLAYAKLERQVDHVLNFEE